MSSTEGDHNTWDRASSQVRKHKFFEENTYNQMAQKHSDGHVLWGDKWTLKNLKINTLYKRLGFSFNTWRIKLCLKCSDLLKEELWSIFWVVTKDWNSLPVKNRTEPTQRETKFGSQSFEMPSQQGDHASYFNMTTNAGDSGVMWQDYPLPRSCRQKVQPAITSFSASKFCHQQHLVTTLISIIPLMGFKSYKSWSNSRYIPTSWWELFQ